MFENYLSEVQKTENVYDFSFSKYLSERAQKVVAEKLIRVSIVLTDFQFSLKINEELAEIRNKNVKSSNTSIEPDKMLQLFLNA